MDFNRDWTAFALKAEYDAYGTARIADAHNAAIQGLTRRLREAEAQRDALQEQNDARQRYKIAAMQMVDPSEYPTQHDMAIECGTLADAMLAEDEAHEREVKS